jgi:hypothetical protein
LQEQLQAERDLRAALEVGLSMSSGQFSSARSMDVKVPYYLQAATIPTLTAFVLLSIIFFPVFFRQRQSLRRLLSLKLMLQG